MSKTYKAALFMTLSALSFALMSASVKGVGRLPIWEIVLARNVISILIAAYNIRRTNGSYWGAPENRKYVLARAFTGTLGLILFFYCVTHIVLADATMLNALSPFFVTFLAWIFLKEKLSKIQIPALIIVFLSSLLILKPRFDLAMLPALAGFISAITSGIAHTLIRYMGDKENPDTIVFNFSLIGALVVLPMALLNFEVPYLYEIPNLIGIGVFAAIGQFGMTYAYRYGKAAEVAVYGYSGILFSVFLGYLFWSEVPDNLSIIGGAIMVSMSVFMFRYNSKRAKR